MQKKVSVIVPIYNSEENLSRCIESILSQSHKNLEVILVNDGSTDKSLEICENFSQKDKRIIVISQKNSGVSAARNFGLAVATGKFVQFVDADDYLNSNMTQCLLENITKNNADFVICGYNKLTYDGVNLKVPTAFCSENLKDFKNCFENLYKNAFFNPPWNKLYRREKIKMLFNEKLDIGEDLLFNLLYVRFCNKILVINDALYNYDASLQNGLASQYNEKLFDIQIMLHLNVQEFFENSFNSDDFRNINEVFAKEIYYYLKKLVLLSDKTKYEKLKKIKFCFENNSVKNMLYNINSCDSQIKIICLFMRLKSPQFIYLFFKMKNLISKSVICKKIRKMKEISR